MVIFLWMGKTSKAKPHWVILRLPLPRIHYYHNKQLQVKESQYLIPIYSWTFTLIPNWTCFVVTISHLHCTAPSTWLTNQCTDPSTWLTHQLEKDVSGKVFQFIHTMKIKKLLGYKTLWCTNTAAFSRERWTKAYVSDHNMLVKNFCIKLHSLSSAVTALKIIFIYV